MFIRDLYCMCSAHVMPPGWGPVRADRWRLQLPRRRVPAAPWERRIMDSNRRFVDRVRIPISCGRHYHMGDDPWCAPYT